MALILHPGQKSGQKMYRKIRKTRTMIINKQTFPVEYSQAIAPLITLRCVIFEAQPKNVK